MKPKPFTVTMALACVALSTIAFGCGARELPPPEAPSPTMPAVPDPLATTVPDAHGRVVLDAEGGSALVSRVTSTTEILVPEHHGYRPYAVPLERQTLERLCNTPCTVDLPLGSYQLLFSRPDDRFARSFADVSVSGGSAIVVRHALGHDEPAAGAYVGGAVALVAGIGLTLMGGLILTAANTITPTSGRADFRPTWNAIGGVVGGLGLSLDVTGIVLLLTQRGTYRPGATTTFPITAER